MTRGKGNQTTQSGPSSLDPELQTGPAPPLPPHQSSLCQKAAWSRSACIAGVHLIPGTILKK